MPPGCAAGYGSCSDYEQRQQVAGQPAAGAADDPHDDRRPIHQPCRYEAGRPPLDGPVARSAAWGSPRWPCFTPGSSARTCSTGGRSRRPSPSDGPLAVARPRGLPRAQPAGPPAVLRPARRRSLAARRHHPLQRGLGQAAPPPRSTGRFPNPSRRWPSSRPPRPCLGVALAAALASAARPWAGGRPAFSVPVLVAGLPATGFRYGFSPRPPPLA